jgi:hypothetical protein
VEKSTLALFVRDGADLDLLGFGSIVDSFDVILSVVWKTIQCLRAVRILPQLLQNGYQGKATRTDERCAATVPNLSQKSVKESN